MGKLSLIRLLWAPLEGSVCSRGLVPADGQHQRTFF